MEESSRGTVEDIGRNHRELLWKGEGERPVRLLPVEESSRGTVKVIRRNHLEVLWKRK